jgi:ABC-type transport system involved in multi-copper enzyme maturation permease subunit
MRLLQAELLKLRRRWASYVVLGMLVGVMALIMVLVGISSRDGGLQLRFPDAYGVISQFVFGLGSLLAIAYAAAIAGADWSWGIFGTVVARGEGRARYVLAKALGLAIALVIGAAVAFAAGIVLVHVAGALAGTRSVGDPFSGSGLTDLGASMGLGTLVLLERAGIGFAVAMLLRSQLAGVVVGIVLYIGEAILGALLFAFSFSGSMGNPLGPGGLERRGPEWYQFLPFSIGDSVLSAGPSVEFGGGGGVEDLLLRPVEPALAIAVTLGYLALALGLSAFSARRAELAGNAG